MNAINKLSKVEQELLKMDYPTFRKKYRELQLSRGIKIITELPNGITITKHKNIYGMTITNEFYTLQFSTGTLLKNMIKAAKDPETLKLSLETDGITSINDKKGIGNAIYRHYIESRNILKNNMKYNFKVYRGRKRKNKQRILDVGAGLQPDVRATDAIGLDKFKKSEIKFTNLKYIFGYDLNKQKFPYNDNTFDIIISYGALGINFGNDLTYSEIYRILKPNGMLEIGVHPQNKPAIQECKNTFKQFNYKNIKYSEFKDNYGEIYGRVEGTKP